MGPGRAPLLLQGNGSQARRNSQLYVAWKILGISRDTLINKNMAAL